MKRFFVHIAIILITSAPYAQAASNVDTSEFEFFVKLEQLTPIDTIEAYLEDLNSIELWNHNYSGLALWQVSGFPFTMADGTQIFDINDVIRKSVRKTKIKESDYNLTLSLDDIPEAPAGSCFNPLDYSMPHGTERNIKISILDSGIDSTIQNSSTPSLNYNLLNYSGYDYVNDDDIPEDEHGHGTHIAGLIHSITHAIDSTGVSIDFDIRKTHDSLGQGKMSNIVKGLLDAVDDNSNIINMSFGRTDTFDLNTFFPLRTAIQYALQQNCIITTSAGNSNSNNDVLTNTTTPSVFPEGNVLSIAALSCLDSLTTFSNFGSATVDIGVLGKLIPGPDLSGGIRYASGTSQAAAIATAVMALIGTHVNNFNATTLKCSILNGSAIKSSLEGLILTEGKLDPSAALLLYQNTQPIYTVINLNDDGPGSLRYGIQGVCGVDKIIFDPIINGQTINLVGKELLISRPIEIIGNGPQITKINSQNYSAFRVDFSGNFMLRDLKISTTATNVPTVINHGNITIKQQVSLE